MKRLKIDLETKLQELVAAKSVLLEKRKTLAENLDLDYALLFTKSVADEIFSELEKIVEYYEGELTKVKVFGKWHQIPRQQVAYGDAGVKYRFSGVTIPAKPWPPLLKSMRDIVNNSTGFDYNFVLINRYRDGRDHIGEHRDNESDLDNNTPIASLSLGQHRVFVLRHRDARTKSTDRRSIAPVKIELQHGSLLMMNPPTNEYWYHSLPPRKTAPGVRVNLTFRKIVSKQ